MCKDEMAKHRSEGKQGSDGLFRETGKGGGEKCKVKVRELLEESKRKEKDF
jgi:hypothetical protein